VERLVLELFKKQAITDDQFITAANGAKLFTSAARRRFLDHWETQMLRTVHHGASERKVTYRLALELQARQVAACLLAPKRLYVGMTWR
jgi:CRISPR/Cas system-associated endonuclease Cas1